MNTADLLKLIRQADNRRLKGTTQCPDPKCGRLTGTRHKRGCLWLKALDQERATCGVTITVHPGSPRRAPLVIVPVCRCDGLYL